MLSSIASWFVGLSQIGKASIISSVVLGGMFVGAVTSPDSTPVQPVVPIVQQPIVTTEVKTESQAIPFEAQTVEDASLAQGVREVRTHGVDGVKTVTHTITLTDGVETSRTTNEEVTTSSVTQVTAIGTYVAPVIQSAPVSSSAGVVKMSRTSICHAPGTTYYNQTKNYTSYDSLDACLGAGGRMPKR